MYDNRVTNESIENSRQSSSLRVPSTLKSVGVDFAETATALPRFAFDMHQALRGLPARNPLDDSFEVFNKSMETPNEGWGQKTFDFFASGIGYLNPLSDLALIKPASAAVGGIASAITRSLPSEATALARTPIRQFGGKLAEYLPDTIGGAGEHLAKSLAIGTALTAPEAFLDNYNPKTGKFEIMGAVNQSFSNGMLAMALDTIPITAGMVFGKHKKSFNLDYEHPSPGDKDKMASFDSALDKGEITPGEHSWVKTYLENPNDMKALKKKGVDLLLKDGYSVDHGQQKVLMNIIKKEHYDDFHTGMMDQMSSGAHGDFASSLSDYTAGQGMDFMTSENSKFLDGFNGYVDFMEKRLGMEDKNLKAFREARTRAGFENIEDSHPISQKGLFQELKAVDHDLQRLPHGIPKNVRYRARQERDIFRLKTEISRFKKLARRDNTYESKIDEASAKLRELKSSREKLLTPNNELKALEEHFLGKKLLPEKYRHSHDYHRLVDLSHFSKKADALLHHIDLKDQYETQTAYKDLIKFLNGVVGSNVKRFADPSKVVDYFKARLDSVGQDIDELSNRKDTRNIREVPIESGRGAYSDVPKKDELRDMQQDMKSDVTNDKEVLQANETDVDSADSKKYEEEFKHNKDRYQQFKSNQNALSQLVSCELGTKENG
jgi:hypothetical protein